MLTEYRFTIKVKAANKAEAEIVANFLDTIYKQCSNKELIEAAKEVKEDPKIIRKLIQVASNGMVRSVVSKFIK